MPSKKKKSKHRTLPFHDKIQHVCNAESDLMLECEECGMIYAKRKLSPTQCKSLQDLLEGMSFSCGSPLQELSLPSNLVDEVSVHDLNCSKPIELLYYSAKYDPICVYCAKEEHFSNDKFLILNISLRLQRNKVTNFYVQSFC